jgi:hypothetical protein
MASNFRFTGAPKVAKYNPKGLDFFLAAPKLEAEVRGAALRANELSETNKVGLHSSDLAAANAMTQHIDESRSDITDSILANEPVSDILVANVVKNFQQKKEVQQKLTKGLQNAKRIEELESEVRKLGWQNPKAKTYYDQIRSKSLEGWKGSWNPDGSMNDFVPIDAPGYVDVIGDAKKRFDVAKANMTPEQREALSKFTSDDIKVVQKTLPDGSVVPFYAMQKEGLDETNAPALNAVLNDLNRTISDPNSLEFQYLNFMGEGYAQGIIDALPGIMEDYMHTDNKTTIQAGQLSTGKGSKGSTGKGAAGGIFPTANEKFTLNNVQFKTGVSVNAIDVDNFKTLPAGVSESEQPIMAKIGYDPKDNTQGSRYPVAPTGLVFNEEAYNAEFVDLTNKVMGSSSPSVSDLRTAYFGDGTIKVNGVVQKDANGKPLISDAYQYSPEFSAFVHAKAAKGGSILDLANNMAYLEQQNIDNLNITSDEYNATDERTKTIVRKKQRVLEQTSALYNEYQETQKQLMRGFNLEFGDKTSQQEFNMNLRDSEREVMTFVRDSANNTMSLIGDTKVDQVEGQGGWTSSDTRHAFDVRVSNTDFKSGKGMPSAPKLIPNMMIESIRPDLFEGKTPEEREQIKNHYKDWYMYEYTSGDPESNIPIQTYYTFVQPSDADNVRSPMNMPVQDYTGLKEGDEVPVKSLENVIDGLGNRGQATVTLPGTQMPVIISKRGNVFEINMGGQVMKAKSEVDIVDAFRQATIIVNQQQAQAQQQQAQ